MSALQGEDLESKIGTASTMAQDHKREYCVIEFVEDNKTDLLIVTPVEVTSYHSRPKVMALCFPTGKVRRF